MWAILLLSRSACTMKSTLQTRAHDASDIYVEALHEPSEGNAWQERKTEGEEVTAHRPRVAEKGAHAGAINAET